MRSSVVFPEPLGRDDGEAAGRHVEVDAAQDALLAEALPYSRSDHPTIASTITKAANATLMMLYREERGIEAAKIAGPYSECS